MTKNAWLIGGTLVVFAAATQVTRHAEAAEAASEPLFAAEALTNADLFPSDDRCRRVVVPEGLNLRAQPNLYSPVVGRMVNQQIILLSTNPATVNTIAGLNWVQASLADGTAGWVSNGAPGSGGNMILCSAAPKPLVPKDRTCRVVRSPVGGSLAVRSVPAGPVVTGLTNGQTVVLVNPDDVRLTAGRKWLQLRTPVAGWVSNDQPGSGVDLVDC